MAEDEMKLRPANMSFVEDRRASGWWTTVISQYVTNDKELESEMMMITNVKEALKVHVRYRIYLYELRVIMVSCHVEDADKITDALYMYRFETPKPIHFTATQIFWEHIPYQIDLYDVMHIFFFQHDARTVLRYRNMAMGPARVEYNFVCDMINHIAKRLIIDIPGWKDRDFLLKRICLKNFFNLDKDARKNEKRWIGYNNLYFIKNKLDMLYKRKENEHSPFLKRYFPLTREQFNSFQKTYPEDFIFNDADTSERSEVDNSEYGALNELTDNEPIRNADVVRNRGLFLAGSNTYPNSKPEKKKPTTSTSSAGASTSSSKQK